MWRLKERFLNWLFIACRLHLDRPVARIIVKGFKIECMRDGLCRVIDDPVGDMPAQAYLIVGMHATPLETVIELSHYVSPFYDTCRLADVVGDQHVLVFGN